MARNKAADLYRQVARQNKVVHAAISELPTEVPSAEDTALENLAHEETVNRVHTYLLRLTPGEQDLLLQASSDRPLADIAEELGITYTALRVRVHRARQKLKDLMSTPLEELGEVASQPQEPPKRRRAPPTVIPRPRREPAPVEATEATFDPMPPQDIIDLDALVFNPPEVAPEVPTPRAAAESIARKPRTPRARKPSVKEPEAKSDNAVSLLPPHHVNLPTPDPTYVRETSVGQHESLFATAGLNPEEVDVLTWSDVDGYSTTDLSGLLGKSKGALEARLQRLRRQVREYVEGERTA